MQDRRNEHFIRRVNQVGNSLSVGIPKDIAKEFDIIKGDEVFVSADIERGEIILKKVVQSENPNIRPEVIEAMKRVKTQYGKALLNLKDR